MLLIEILGMLSGGASVFCASLYIFRSNKIKSALQVLTKSQFSTLLEDMPKTYIATTIRGEKNTREQISAPKLKALTSTPSKPLITTELKDLSIPQSITGDLRNQANSLTELINKTLLCDLSTESKYNIGVILEQFLLSLQLFDKLPNDQKSATLTAQLLHQWSTLESAAKEIYLYTTADIVQRLNASSTFVETKFRAGLRLDYGLKKEIPK